MKKVLGEVFFCLTMLTFTYINWSVYLYNGKPPFTDAPLIIFVLLMITFYIAYGITSHRLIITKKKYNNKKIYKFTRSLIYISLILYAFLIDYNKVWTLAFWLVLTAIMFIDKKQTQ